MRITQEHVDSLYDADVVDQNGDKVGGVGQVYLDDATGAPAWVTAKTGLFGTRETFVPLSTADLEDGRIRVPYEKDFIKDAPSMDADEHLDESQEEDLYRYYSVQGGGAGTSVDGGTGTFSGGNTGPVVDRRDTGTAVDPAPLAEADRERDGVYDDRTDTSHHDADRGHTSDRDRMTLHEERVDVGTEQVETGRVRLRKHVVEDQKTVTVPVQREEFEVVREPVADGQVGDRSDLGDDEVEVAVHEERPVIDKDVVATEEVGVDRRVVTDERDVTTDVAHEEVEVVDDGARVRDDDVDRRG